jgi:hypothetical protein
MMIRELRSEGTAMTETVFTPERRGIGARFGDVLAGAKDMTRAGLSEAMTWDMYKWTVLALMTATFILVALSYGGIRSELATLKQERSSATTDQSALKAEIGKQMSDMQAALAQAIADAKTGLSADIGKISTKLDAKPKAPAPAPKPRPRPQQ